jgi:hypothetical protein
MAWIVQVMDGRRSSKFARPMYRQPAWSETEAMVSSRDHVSQILITRSMGDTLSALLDATSTLVSETIGVVGDLWDRRKADRTLLVQPGRQWPAVAAEDDLLNFDGAGEELRVQGGEVRIHPDNAKRLRAAKIFDTDAEIWRDE